MHSLTRVTSKWTKTKVLERSAYLKKRIPTTLRLNEASLLRLLRTYGMAYVKPERGSCGVGVMRVERDGRGWTVRDGVKRRVFGTYEKLYAWLRRRTAGVSYLAQRGVRMLRHNGRPVDFRVVIQKDRAAGWKITGTAARVAHPQKAVTNGSQGGSIYAAGALLRRKVGGGTAARLQREFGRLARATARRLGGRYPRMRELGLDIAVDRGSRAWILEVNTSPDPCPFAKLADASMLREIIRVARGYGRRYDLRCSKARKGR